MREHSWPSSPDRRPRSGALPSLVAAVILWTSIAACGNGDSPEPSESESSPPIRSAEAAPEPQERSTADAARQEEPTATGDRVRVSVGGIPVEVDVADTPEARERGLMFRDSLADDEGMLFVYSGERTLSFWMKNTAIPLDVAFLDRTGRIVDIQQMEPFDEETTSSRRPAMYALELRQGWFEDHGVGVGDRVEF